MTASIPDDFITTALEPDLLEIPFKIQTNWQVITGAPCSGKTTLIDQLANKGFRTVAETARIYMEKEISNGRTIEEIRENVDALERGLIEMQLKYERGLKDTDIVFLDRGSPDGLTYCRIAGMDPNEILPECFHFRYASIFILDRLPILQDNIRIEDEATANFLDEWLVRDYRTLRYRVVRVPVFPIQERVKFVLEKLSE